MDAWGVDYGLLGADGVLVDLPTCYRDPRQLPAMDEALATVGRERLYRSTGVQLNEINTVFALMSDARTTTRLDDAAALLMMPDVFHHLRLPRHRVHRGLHDGPLRRRRPGAG